MSRTLSPVALVTLCACGQIAGGHNDAGLPDSAGVACNNANALQSPPTCSVDPDGGADVCQQWADSIVSGAGGACNSGTCTFTAPAKACTPGPDGDAQCQAWLQNYAKTSFAYAKCWPRDPNSPGAYGNICLAADTCTDLGSSGYRCKCGAGTYSTSSPGGGCDLDIGMLCLNVGGTPTCGAWCQ